MRDSSSPSSFKRLGFGAFCGLFTACATVVPHATALDAAWAKGRFPSANAQTLEEGRATYVNRCGGCHSLKAPKSKPQAEWTSWVAKMAPRSRLSELQRTSVLQYLETFSRP